MSHENSNLHKSNQTKTKEEVIDLFKKAASQGKVYKFEKFAKILARPAHPGEKITTIIDGKERTKNTAKEGDFIVKNPDGEEYIVSNEKFKERYKLIGEAEEFPKYKRYQAVGTVWGFQYEGPNFKFEAPWGEEQLIERGDMIVSLRRDTFDDIYGIQKDIFKDTYRKSKSQSA